MDFIIDTNPETSNKNVTKKRKSMKKKLPIKKKRKNDLTKKIIHTEIEDECNMEAKTEVQSKRTLKREAFRLKKLEEKKKREKDLTDTLFGDNFIPEIEEVTETEEENDDDEAYDSEGEHEYDEEENETSKKRTVAWEDDDDENVKLKDVVATFSKAKGTRGVRETSNMQYKKVLQEKFSDVYGSSPTWAQLDRKVEDDDDEEEEENSMITKTSTYLASKTSLAKLPKTSLMFKLVSNLNKDSYREGVIIKSIDFSDDMKIALVAGCSSTKFGSATLFQFDGKTNLKIKNVLFPKFPIQCARFISNKQQFVVGSNLYGRFYVYDIQAGKKLDIPWTRSSDKNSIKQFEVTPDGNYIAFLGKGGEITFYDSQSYSVFENLKVPCEVNAIAFSPDSNFIYTYGDNGRVYIFDLVDWRCIHSFYDDGCIEGTAIATSPNGKLLSCGSSTGIVNMYELSSIMDSDTPTPLKSFGSLVSPITSLVFNATSEILATASSYKENAIKLIHTGSLTYFANFPGGYSFKRIQTLKFTGDSKYLAAGSNVKIAHLFRLFYY